MDRSLSDILLTKLSLHEYSLKSAIAVGELFVPVNRVEEVVARFATSLHVLDEANLYSFSLAGSMFLVRVQSDFYGIVSRHQIVDQDPQTLAIQGVKEGNFVTSSGLTIIHRNKDKIDDDQYDFALLRFSEPVAAMAIDRTIFCNIQSLGIWDGEERPVCFFAVGFPYEDQEYTIPDNYHETNRVDHVQLRKRVALFEYSGESVDESLFRFSRIGAEAFNSDGMSGGPLFAVLENYGNYSVRFAGLVLRGGRSPTLYAMKATRVLHLLKKAVTTDT